MARKQCPSCHQIHAQWSQMLLAGDMHSCCPKYGDYLLIFSPDSRWQLPDNVNKAGELHRSLKMAICMVHSARGLGWIGWLGWYGGYMAHSCHAVCRITVIISYSAWLFARLHRPRSDFDPFDIIATHQRAELANFRPRIGQQINTRTPSRSQNEVAALLITFGRSLQLLNKLHLVRFN